MFCYSDTYAPTSNLRTFYDNSQMQSHCCRFVARKDATNIPQSTHVLRLYASLNRACTIAEWCERMRPRNYHVDEMRLIVYGIVHGIIRQIQVSFVWTVFVMFSFQEFPVYTGDAGALQPSELTAPIRLMLNADGSRTTLPRKCESAKEMSGYFH